MFDKQPKLVNISQKCFSRPGYQNNCLKGCQWAPDGSCLCTNSDDHRIRIYNLPEKFLQSDSDFSQEIEEIFPVLELKESQIIYDYCWYPFMNSSDYATCFLLCCSRDVPIHLWDAYTGNLYASYIAQNNVFELVSARSVRFLSCGTKILAGYEKFICLFDLARPGKYADYIYDVPKGIVSCLSCNDKMIASGSFSRFIGLYDPTTMENVAILQGHRGGVTHLMLSPDGQRLYSGARKDNEILCWDLRNYGQILHIIKRDCPTNQRIYFDIDFQHEILFTGDNGMVKIFDLRSITTFDDCEEIKKEKKQETDNKKILSSFNEFFSNESRLNGVSIHPSLPILATTSGERCLLDFDEQEENLMFDYKKQYTKDNNLKLWWLYK